MPRIRALLDLLYGIQSQFHYFSTPASRGPLSGRIRSLGPTWTACWGDESINPNNDGCI